MLKLASAVALLAIATFAPPSLAQVDKTYSLKISNADLTFPATIQGGATTTIVAVFDNEGPPGSNSSFNSVQLGTPSSRFVILSATPDSGKLASAIPAGGATSISIVKTTPQRVDDPPFKVTMSVKSLDASSTCAATPAGNWSSTASTGSGNTNQNFAYAASGNSLSMNVTADCSVAFVTQPADALAGSVITSTPFNTPAGVPVKVRLRMNGAAPPATTVSVNSAACSIAASETTDANGDAVFSSLASTASADVSGCVLTAGASGYPSANSTPPFKILAPAGTLGCIFSGPGRNNSGGTLDPEADNAYGLPGGEPQAWGLVRGPNTDGGDCTPIPYVFTLNPDNTASFIADKLGQKVIVEYVVIWAPVAAEAAPGSYPGAGNQLNAGWTQRRPALAWGIGTPGPSDYVPALACVVDDVSSGLAALPIIPDVDPFHGNAHSQYLPGAQAAMCVAQHGWTAVGGGNVQYWSKIIDTDGFVRLP
jgi:hypothetical protein